MGGRSSLALRKIRLFDGLPDPTLDRLAQACTWRSLPAQAILVSQREASTDLLLLVMGRVRVTTFASNGKQVTFRDAGTGEHIGEVAAVDGRPRSAHLVTLEPSVVASLRREVFLDLITQEPIVASRVLHGLAALVRQLSERVIDLSTLSVGDRLAIEVLRLAEAVPSVGNTVRIEPAPRQGDLAHLISTSREQISREMNDLVRAGLLARTSDALVVNDLDGLRRRVAR